MIYINKNKLKNFDMNKDNTFLILDFDKTITTNENMDSWEAIINPNIVGKEIGKEMDKLYGKYRPIEIDYNISKEEKLKHMKYWYSECMNLYYKYNLSKKQLQDSISNSDIKFRKGFKEILIKMHSYRIPVVILSAGIGNTIKQFLEENNCLFNDTMYIISNFIEFDENGKVKKFDNNKFIYTINKKMNGHLPKEFFEKIKNRKYKMLIGDLVEDISMVNRNELDTTITIGILNKKMSDNDIKIYKDNFDVLIEDDDNVEKFILNCFQI